mmetsp:Transcript_96982/g.277491  ORF Transcript_96982/g.277491 Transcript_96982/m.277491 type:complete len:448 (-) Transcript_96982:165-1508(-)
MRGAVRLSRDRTSHRRAQVALAPEVGDNFYSTRPCPRRARSRRSSSRVKRASRPARRSRSRPRGARRPSGAPPPRGACRQCLGQPRRSSSAPCRCCGTLGPPTTTYASTNVARRWASCKSCLCGTITRVGSSTLWAAPTSKWLITAMLSRRCSTCRGSTRTGCTVLHAAPSARTEASSPTPLPTPYHTAPGLELLSTALWHLKEEVELCYLAQRVSEFDKYSPEVWCVVGNCFSLQKEHETALKFFQRAIQVDPEFTYAYTLCGHEFVANEDLEKAICMFRNAIQCDSRHYNAWFGIGSIYTKQEKFALAEYHFRRALQINPQSSVLYCHLSLALYENKKFDEALGMLKLAAHLEPRNPQVWFQRATILMSMDKNDEALQELLDVQAHSPKEAQVYFWMGKVCKKLGRIDEALRYFTFALDLDPKDNTQIKNALERLEQADVEEESF